MKIFLSCLVLLCVLCAIYYLKDDTSNDSYWQRPEDKKKEEEIKRAEHDMGELKWSQTKAKELDMYQLDV